MFPISNLFGAVAVVFSVVRRQRVTVLVNLGFRHTGNRQVGRLNRRQAKRASSAANPIS